jgi:hypothetical protein
VVPVAPVAASPLAKRISCRAKRVPLPRARSRALDRPDQSPPDGAPVAVSPPPIGLSGPASPPRTECRPPRSSMPARARAAARSRALERPDQSPPRRGSRGGLSPTNRTIRPREPTPRRVAPSAIINARTGTRRRAGSGALDRPDQSPPDGAPVAVSPLPIGLSGPASPPRAEWRPPRSSMPARARTAARSNVYPLWRPSLPWRVSPQVNGTIRPPEHGPLRARLRDHRNPDGRAHSLDVPSHEIP